MRVIGIEKARAKLKALNKSASGKIIRKSLSKGGIMAKRIVKSNVPVETGALRRSISTRNRVKKGVRMVIVGVKSQYKDPKTGKIPNLYAPRVEFGQGHMPMRSFIRATVLQSGRAISTVVGTMFIDGVETEVAKLRGS